MSCSWLLLLNGHDRCLLPTSKFSIFHVMLRQEDHVESLPRNLPSHPWLRCYEGTSGETNSPHPAYLNWRIVSFLFQYQAFELLCMRMQHQEGGFVIWSPALSLLITVADFALRSVCSISSVLWPTCGINPPVKAMLALLCLECSVR